MSSSLKSSPSLFGDLSVDHAIAGFGAGTVATLVMHPLDLVKVRFQLAETPRPSSSSPVSIPPTSAVASSSSNPTIPSLPSTSRPTSGGAHSPMSSRVTERLRPRLGTGVYRALEDAVKADGWKGLYRGLIPNLVGGASSWGLYFLFYNMIKKRMQGDDPAYRTTSSQHLLAAAEASALRTIYTHEGIKGLYKGSLLALVGVSNGSIQFAAYEGIKRRRTDLKRKMYESKGRKWRVEDEKLTNTEYILASGSSKLVAIALTYPYQVVRARLQNAPVGPSLPKATIPGMIASTYRNEGLLAFYKGLGTNALRILPGTCTTFVVYENLVWLFRAMAVKREETGRLF